MRWQEDEAAKIEARLFANISDVASGLKVFAGASKREENTEATLLFAGDIMLSRAVGDVIKKTNDPTFPFLKIKEYLDKADLRFANLEGPISDQGANQGSIYSFRDDPKAVQGLTYAGFNVLSVANNHILDWGRDALTQTIEFLEVNRIVPVGAGRNEPEANDPKIVEVKNNQIIFLGYTNLLPKSLNARGTTPGLSTFDLKKVTDTIRELKSFNQANVIIVSMHWGEEYQAYASAEQKRIAHALIDAGADLIVGHHPHVVQEFERYKEGWIAYSLGNFVFDQNFSSGIDETERALILKVTAAENKILKVELVPMWINGDFQPEVVR